MAVVPLVLGVAMAYFLHQVYMLAIAGPEPGHADRQLPERAQARPQDRRPPGGGLPRAQGPDRARRQATRWRPSAPRRTTSSPTRPPCCPSPPARGAGCGSGAAPTPTTCVLRVGTADLPSGVELTDPEQDEHRGRWSGRSDAPVTIPLPERGVIGVAGPATLPRAAGRWLVAQAAALHSPNDLRIYLLTDSSGQDELGVGPLAAALPARRPGRTAPR